MLRPFLLLLSLASLTSLSAQQWVELLGDPSKQLDVVQQAFQQKGDSLSQIKGKGYKPYKRQAWFLEPRLHPEGRAVDPAVVAKGWDDAQRMVRSSDARTANWQPLGLTSWASSSYNPGNGRVNVVVVDPSDANTIHVGTPLGGLWRSTDNGTTWNNLFNDLPSMGVSGIAIDPTDPDIIYVATGDGDGRHTYGMGVIKSTNGGATWNSTGLDWATHQVRTTRRLLMHPTDPQILLCAASNGLWRTTDAGTSWTLVETGAFHDVEFKPGDPSVVYACTKGFHRSVDGGASFSLVATGLPAQSAVNRMRIAVTPADPAVVYVLAGRSDNNGFRGLYRSTDSGQGFTLRSNTPNLFGYQESGSDAGGQSWFDMALAVDPAFAQVVYVGGINVWKSTNGGTDWNIRSHWIYPSAVGYTHADIHDLAFFNGDLFCGSDGGLFRSTDGATTWNDLSEGLDITQFYRLGGSELEPGTVIAGSIDNGTNLLTGGIWTHVQGADGMEAIIDHGDPQVMYCTMQNGSLYRSLNGGADFTNISGPISETGNWVTPFVMNPANAQQLYAGYDNVWRSNDRGDTWTAVSSFGGGGGKLRAVAIAPSDPSTIYVSNLTLLRRSTTGMAPWTNITAGLPAQAITSIAVHPFDRDIVYITLSGYRDGEKVYVSSNGGGSWTNITRNLPNTPANSLVFESGSNGGLYVGTDLGVFYTDSTLSNWQPFSEGLPRVVVNELEINYASGQLRAATYGRGIWWTNLYQPSGSPPLAGIGTSDLQVCPGASIRFHDMSLEAAPGWTWSFPGGIPASSTSEAPLVVYPASGTYSVGLTVNNSYGPDTQVLNLPVEVLTDGVTISLTLDNYPQESAWSISSESNGAVVATGGPYVGRPPGGTVSEQICLPAGCYYFTMHDAYGDGMCCSQGNGSYQVADLLLDPLASGGSFLFEESTLFCLSATVGLGGVLPPESWAVRPLDDAGRFLLTHAAAGNKQGQLMVVDVLGREVLRAHLRVAEAGQEVDLRMQASGAYRLVVSTLDLQWSTTLVKP